MKTSTGLLVLTLAMAGLLPACGSDGAEAAEKKLIVRKSMGDSVFAAPELESTIDKLVSAIGETEPQELKLSISLKALTGYWEPVVVGANRALGELDVSGAVEAPEATESEDSAPVQEEMIAETIEDGCNGLGLAPIKDGVIDEIEAASKAGIPVVTVDSDLANSKRDIYIGTMNVEAGKTAGQSLAKLLPAGAGTVVILGYDNPEWPDGYDRTMAAIEAIESAGYKTVVRKTVWPEEDSDIQAMTEIIRTADPPVVGMLGMFSNAYRCAMAVEAAGKTKEDIAVAAFDFDSKTVAFMQSGLIQVTHAQRQYYMGYLTPYILYGMNVLGKEKTKALLEAQMVDDYRLNAGLDVVQAEQLDEYYAFLDRLGISGS